jgi:predicted RNase H-like HicB family nuclease
MQTVKYVYWQEDDAWLGYLQDYPDYWTQGETLDDLIAHLRDLYQDLTSGQLTGVRKVGELVVS